MWNENDQRLPWEFGMEYILQKKHMHKNALIYITTLTGVIITSYCGILQPQPYCWEFS